MLMLILMLMLSPGPEMDTRICRDGPSRGATEDHYSPQKGSPTQPNRDPPQILQIVPPRRCLHHHHHHHHQDCVKSHLLRMVVVALPLTHQNGPRRGILRAQPSL